RCCGSVVRLRSPELQLLSAALLLSPTDQPGSRAAAGPGPATNAGANSHDPPDVPYRLPGPLCHRANRRRGSVAVLAAERAEPLGAMSAGAECDRNRCPLSGEGGGIMRFS